ncbi:ABC transporter permease [Faecalimicrobium sp. JNUCC 81]
MNIIRLTLSNLKRYLKSPSLILPMILMPALLIYGLLFTFSTNESDSPHYLAPIALICDLDGKYEKQLINDLELKDNLFDIKDENKAIDLLKNNEVSSVFVLNKDFSKNIDNLDSPTVKSFETENGGGSIWAKSKIDSFISNSLNNKRNLNVVTTTVIEHKSPLLWNSFLFTFMTSYMLYVTNSAFCQDLLILRRSNVLKRMLSTKNKDFEILFSLFLSLFLVQSLSSTFVLLLTTKFNVNLDMIGIIVANCFVSTGLILLFTRIFKQEATIGFASTIFPLLNIALILPLLIPSFPLNTPFINNLAKLSPFYWTIKYLQGDSILVSLIALILLGLVSVTCGSLKLRDFAKN